MKPSRFQTKSLQAFPQGEAVARILSAAVESVEPGAAVRRHLKRVGDRLTLADQTYDLTSFRRVRVVGAGKAGAPMAAAIESILADRLEDGLVIVKEGYREPGCRKIQLLEAGHPLPDERGVLAARQLNQMLQDSQSDDMVICLLSGGGSALLVSPATGVALGAVQDLTGALLRSGANIQEINTLRKHLETLKGGNLARRIAPARLITLVLSDVIGDPLDMIASGPTVPDPTSFQQAWEILERFDLIDQAPQAILTHLQKGLEGQIEETPKSDNLLFERTQILVIGSNRLAAQAALEQARLEGFNTLLLTTSMQGEARQVGRVLASIGREMAESGRPVPRPGCVIAGGETTVTVTGDGLGGRNQELALGAVADLAGIQKVMLISLATDGGDGPTDAAGAVVTGATLERAQALGLNATVYLKNNDAYHLFDPLDDLLKPGPTMTNVNDLTFIFSL